MTPADDCQPTPRVQDVMSRIDSVRCGAETLILAAGELDLVVRDELRAAVEAAAGGELVLDLGAVSFVDVSTITLLAMAAAQRSADGLVTFVMNPQPQVRQVFVLARAQQLLAPG
jgi:anti-anti-sigma factor